MLILPETWAFSSPCLSALPYSGGHRVHRARLGSKKYGSSTSGMWAGLLGALVGALAGLPLLFGLGAFIGALVGAWIGCYLMERYKGRNDYEARQAAKGALVGRFLGIVVKCGIGAVMLGLTCHAIFQVPVYPEVTIAGKGGRNFL
ncbi:MAG: DUF456 domain-containing protein [Bilophila wadsworthia]